MKNNRLKMGIIGLSLILIFSLILMLSAYLADYNTVIRANWGISLPKGYRKESYSSKSEQSFFGDGYRYHIFDYKKEFKQKDIEEFSFEKNANVEADVEEILSFLEVDELKKPDFSEKYYWYKKNDDNDPRDKLYIIYVVKYNKLYVVEEFL